MKGIIRWLIKMFYVFLFRVEVRGIENWPVGQGKIICANHISQHDPVVIGAMAPEYLKFMAKHTIFKFKPFEIFLRFAGGFPVNRDKNDLKAIKTAMRAVKDDMGVLIFAEGTRNYTTTPLEVKAGVAMIAIKSKVPILPVTVDSTYKLFSKIIITVHPAIRFEDLEGQKLSNEEYQEISQGIMNDIYSHLDLYKGRQKS